MGLGNNHNEMIGKYLSGKMEPREKAAFELEMAADPRLRQEVNNLAGFYVGLTAMEKVDAGHIDIDLLVRYQENRDELDNDTRQKIKAHLKSCPKCAEELRLCSLIPMTDPELGTESGESIFTRIKNFLFAPRLRLQPAVGLIAIIILAVPAIYMVKNYSSPGIRTASYRLEPGTRDVEQKNIIVVGKDHKIIRLEFTPAVADDCLTCLYDFELYDPSGRLRLISKDNKHQKDFAFELTDHYFSSRGYYTIKIIETAENGNREIIDIYQILIEFKQ